MNQPAPPADHLPPQHVQHILAMLALLAAPHLLRMPLWLGALVLSLGAWRSLAAQRTWAMPRPWLRNLLTVLCFGAIYAHFRTFNGHHAGVALLLGMLAMKLTEMNQRRDYLVVIYLSYFLLVTHFLFSQEMLMLPLLLLGALAVTMVLIEVNHPQGGLPLRLLARLGGLLMLQSLPLMLVFFLLFPRIPGPLWGLPSDPGDAISGLDETMDPGGISNLSLSDEVAFRVRFDGPVPPAGQLYWRGPVLEDFDGRSWRVSRNADFPRAVTARYLSDTLSYEMQLEPHGKKWLLALDLPQAPLPANTELGPDLVLRHRYDIRSKMLFRLNAVTDHRVEEDILPYVIRRNLQTPPEINPRARALAAGWRAQAGDDEAVIRAALAHFRERPFTYTLQPPPLFNDNLIDEFLFDSQRGFCEHYASAFTFLMRVAGVPARVVTGYQGAGPNGDYYIVRQSDAHAWSEVWLHGRGWVRVDPTAAVAPDRIEFGLGRSLPQGEPVPGLARPGRDLLIRLRLGWDQVNEAWNRWFLAYGPELQRDFLRKLGLPSLRAMLLALTLSTIALLIGVGLWAGRQYRDRAESDAVLRLWRRYLARLRRAGLKPRASEGPRDLTERVALQRPAWATAARGVGELYVELRYAGTHPDPLRLREFRQRVRRFPRTP